MQSVPDARQQTFEEIYGPPENFLEIEVRNPARSDNHHHRNISFNDLTKDQSH